MQNKVTNAGWHADLCHQALVESDLIWFATSASTPVPEENTEAMYVRNNNSTNQRSEGDVEEIKVNKNVVNVGWHVIPCHQTLTESGLVWPASPTLSSAPERENKNVHARGTTNSTHLYYQWSESGVGENKENKNVTNVGRHAYLCRQTLAESSLAWSASSAPLLVPERKNGIRCATDTISSIKWRGKRTEKRVNENGENKKVTKEGWRAYLCHQPQTEGGPLWTASAISFSEPERSTGTKYNRDKASSITEIKRININTIFSSERGKRNIAAIQRKSERSKKTLLKLTGSIIILGICKIMVQILRQKWPSTSAAFLRLIKSPTHKYVYPRPTSKTEMLGALQTAPISGLQRPEGGVKENEENKNVTNEGWHAYPCHQALVEGGHVWPASSTPSSVPEKNNDAMDTTNSINLRGQRPERGVKKNGAHKIVIKEGWRTYRCHQPYTEGGLVWTASFIPFPDPNKFTGIKHNRGKAISINEIKTKNVNTFSSRRGKRNKVVIHRKPEKCKKIILSRYGLSHLEIVKQSCKYCCKNGQVPVRLP
ncbi:hypothetical protein RR48_01323 [Papilio machaon]|uniref:Uncharacterized protein n=1 Tax=Papilio machaon TaxID=76193 RepID=A0A0N1IPI8_PAPMA|nr:hypothetical protein RR48_01323 [Papilio machaon]